MEVDERTGTVTMRHAKTQTVQMMIKLEASSIATMLRIESDVDCDNFWIGVKPADSVVFNDVLFDNKQLVVKSIDFELRK